MLDQSQKILEETRWCVCVCVCVCVCDISLFSVSCFWYMVISGPLGTSFIVISKPTEFGFFFDLSYMDFIFLISFCLFREQIKFIFLTSTLIVFKHSCQLRNLECIFILPTSQCNINSITDRSPHIYHRLGVNRKSYES